MAAPSRVTITGATNASPIVITSTGHGYTTGNSIQITGVGGNNAANGIWVITVIDANSYSLNDSTGDGGYTSGGNSSKITGTLPATPDDQVVPQEATTTTGTGDISLIGSLAGSVPIAVTPDGSIVEYRIISDDGTQFEHGIGTYNADDNTITRTEIISTSNSEIDDSPVNLSAGQKTIITVADAGTPDSVGDDVGEPVVLVQGTPEWTNNGRLSTQIYSNVDDGIRLATGTTVYFIPNSVDDGLTIRLLQTRQALAISRVDWQYRDIVIPATTDAIRIRADIASDLPFAVDANKLPATNILVAKKPADVFMYLPNRIGVQPAPAPVMFYLPWYSSTARNNGNAGSPVGHDVVFDDGGWDYLAVSGPYSTFITDLRGYAKIARRYVYLGTMGGLTDGIVSCEQNKMMLWNNKNRISYIRSFRDPTTEWAVPLSISGRNLFSRLNAATYSSSNGNINDSPWSFFFVTGRNLAENALPSAYFGIVGYGNVRAKVAAYDAANNAETLRSTTDNTELISRDRNDDTWGAGPDAGLRNLQIAGSIISLPSLTTVGKAARTSIGYRAYQVMSALGSNPLITSIDPNADRLPVFRGDGSVISISGEC